MEEDHEKTVEIIEKLKINVAPNPKHREALRRRVLAVFDSIAQPWQRYPFTEKF